MGFFVKFIEYDNKSFLIFLIAVLFIFSLAINGVNASDYYVNGTGGDDNNIGNSSNPYASIGKAVNKTNSESGSNKIIIKDGHYNGNKNNIITIKKSVNIYGAKYYYKNNNYGETIINGSENWIFKINSGITVNFYGITFTNANSTNGGAMSISNSKVSVNNCTFKDSYRSKKGGGIYVVGSKSVLNVNNCNFSKNHADYGAGIYGENVNTINIKNSNFIRNSGSTYNNEEYSGNGGGNGGAIYTKNCKINILNSTFTDNYAIYGGAITLYKSISNITSCNFKENTAGDYSYWDDMESYYDGYGGAIAILNSSVNITKSIFKNNYLYEGFGSVIFAKGSKNILNLKYCSFIENNIEHNEVIFLNGGEASINSCNFTKNGGFSGSSVIYNKANLKITKSRFTKNNNYGIDIHNMAYLSISSSIFYCYKSFNEGKAIYNSYALIAKSNKIYNYEYGIISMRQSYNKKDFKYSIIEKNVFKNCDYGIYNYLTKNIKIKHNTILNSIYGIYNRASSSLIEKNTIESKKFGIYIKGNNNYIKSNIIKNKKGINRSFGIYIYKLYKYNSISNNKIVKFYYGVHNKGLYSKISKNKIYYNKIGLLTTKKVELIKNHMKKNKSNIRK